MEGAWQALRRQKRALLHGTTPSACTLLKPRPEHLAASGLQTLSGRA